VLFVFAAASGPYPTAFNPEAGISIKP